MKLIRFTLFVFSVFVVLLFGLALALPVSAQEATDTPPIVILDEDGVPIGDSVIVAAEEPDPLAPLLTLAGTVFGTLELIKTGFLSGLATAGGWKEKPIYGFVLWGLASVLAFALLLGAPEGLDIFTLSGYPNPFGLWFGRVVTALAIGAGSGILNALYTYLRAPKELGTTTTAAIARSEAKKVVSETYRQ